MRLLTFLFLVCLHLLGSEAQGATQPHRPDSSDDLPGVELARGITELTGVAISPLLGMTAMGAWHYYQAEERERVALPWFCHPFAWGTGLGLLGLCFVKDVLGTAAPPLLKKPLDVAELFENKLSALLACSALVPFVLAQMARYHSGGAVTALGSDGTLATVLLVGPWYEQWLALPLAVVGFFTVWLASHAITVLIVLCPFGFIDSLLKLARTALLGIVVASSWISPWLGAAVSLAVLVLAALLAPWAARLLIFGTVFGLDLFRPGRKRRAVRVAEPHAFVVRSFGGLPVRTYGRVRRTAEGTLTFVYRPCAFLLEREVALLNTRFTLDKGLLCPWLSAGEIPARQLLLLPRYSGHEYTVAEALGLSEVRENSLRRGWQAMQAWWSETIGRHKNGDEPSLAG